MTNSIRFKDSSPEDETISDRRSKQILSRKILERPNRLNPPTPNDLVRVIHEKAWITKSRQKVIRLKGEA